MHFDRKKLKISTITRIFSFPKARCILGIEIKKGQLSFPTDKKEAIDRLYRLFKKIIDDDVNVSEVYTKQKTITFLKRLFESGESQPDTHNQENHDDQKSENADQNLENDNQNSENNVQENPRSTERKHLIPDNFSLRIEKGKVNDIYLELKKHLVVRDTPNAVAVLFRVFLEGTVNSYAEKYGFSFEKKTALTKKIEKVTAHLENQHGVGSEKFRKVKNLTNKNTRFLSVEDFHYYVHDNDVKPLENDLRVCWNDLQEFFEIVYNQIQKDKK